MNREAEEDQRWAGGLRIWVFKYIQGDPSDWSLLGGGFSAAGASGDPALNACEDK